MHLYVLYGTARLPRASSPRAPSCRTSYHLARISTAIAVADATTVLLGVAAAMSFKLSIGVVP